MQQRPIRSQLQLATVGKAAFIQVAYQHQNLYGMEGATALPKITVDIDNGYRS